MTTHTSSAICPECGSQQPSAGAHAAEAAAASCSACSAPLALHERYVLRAVLGEAVGTTYLADDTRSGEQVVIKELAFSRLDSWKTEELFQREAAVLRQLDHPRIPDYVDHFALGEGKRQRFYLVQQYLVGRDLRRELSSRRYSEREVLALLDEVLALLEYLQSLRPPLIHRDLKPSNILRLDRDGSIALIDFGSVRDLIAPQSDSPTVAGTFGFMAPEQFQGDAYLQTDIYGLGGVALQLLSRTPPEKMLDTTMQLRWREHVEVSEPLAELLERFLQPDYKQRPASASNARALVRDASAAVARAERRGATTKAKRTPAPSEPPAPPPVLAARPAAGAAQRRALTARVLLIVVAVLLVGGGAGGYLLLAGGDGAPPQPRTRATVPVAGHVQPPAATPPPEVTPPKPPTLTRISEAKLAKVLLASAWRGSLNGVLTFERAASRRKELAGVLRQGSRVVGRFSVELAALGSLTLERRGRSSADTTFLETLYGVLAADHRSITGRWEREYRSGGHSYTKRGVWRVGRLDEKQRPRAR